MSGNNMESLLMGGDDDSSSGESDTEVGVSAATVPAAASVSVQAAPAPAPQPAPSAPAPIQTSAAGMSQSEISKRLKSMYSPANKGKPSVQQQIQQQQQQQQPHQRPPQPHLPHLVPPQQQRPSQPQQQRPSQPQTQRLPQPQTQRPLQPQTQRPPQQQTQRPPQPQTQRPQSHRPSAMPTSVHASRGGVPHQTLPQASRHSMPSSKPVTTHNIQAPGPTSRRSSDPFEPTPVSKIIERQQNLQQKQQQQATRVPVSSSANRSSGANYSSTKGTVSSQASSSSGSTLPASNTTADRAAREREMKKRKERFLVFTRVLMKYLEQKAPEKQKEVKAIIKDCAERNKRQEPGYESVTASMEHRIRKAVSESHWKRAEAYLEHFLQQKHNKSSDKNKSAQEMAARKKQQELERMHQMQARKEAQQQSSSRSRQGPSAQNAPSMESLQRDIANKKRQVLVGPSTSSSSTNKPPSGQSAFVPAPASSSKVSKSQQAVAAKVPTPTMQRKSATDGGKGGEQAAAPGAAAPREYSEFMEMVDHACNFDWTTSGLLLGQKLHHSQLSQEQRNLLHGDMLKPQQQQGKQQQQQQQPTSGPVFPLAGWSRRNVISPRVAWSRIRLPEHNRANSTSTNPVVGNGLLTLPEPGAIKADDPTTKKTPSVNTSWHNEDVAEEDLALAVLSEGAEMYIKSILEKALHCARQRQNLDGVRLWHQQMVPSTKPAFSLRLGCDVNRQAARAAGNAALTSKRMEEALERQEGVPSRERVLKEETLSKAQSMSDLALRPKLSNAVKDADYEAKRSFEVYGGKETTNEPPLGRVPKKAKLEVVDFQMGMNFGFGETGRQKAETVSGSFAF